MKRFVMMTFLLLIGLATGAWFLFRSTKGGPGEDHPADMFITEPAGLGQVIRLADSQTPLRTLHWLGHLPGEYAVAQILTQADRQFLAMARNGKVEEVFQVPKPEGIEERFFRFAVLKDVVLLQNEALVLLYAPLDGADPRPPMVLALDLPSKKVRWSHLGLGQRLALGRSEKESAIFLWGPDVPVTRLPMACAPGEKSMNGARSSARRIEWAPGMRLPSDLLPTGAWTFLAAHRDGLAAYLGSKGWVQQPMPDAGLLSFPDGHGRLARGKGLYWWQPRPGQLAGVSADATVLKPVGQASPALSGDHLRDAQILSLIGTDATGRIWYGLAAPVLSGSAAMPQPSAEEGWKPEAAPSPTEPAPGLPFPEREAWLAYTRADMDRIYCWNPQTGLLSMMSWGKAWSGFGAPAGFSPPKGDAGLQSDASGIIIGDGPRAFWLPLARLPMEPVPARVSPDSRTGSSY